MVKPIAEFQFREIGGLYRDVLAKEGKVLADVLQEYDLIVDDKAEFIRFKDYDKGLAIWYRSYGGQVTITIWKLG